MKETSTEPSLKRSTGGELEERVAARTSMQGEKLQESRAGNHLKAVRKTPGCEVSGWGAAGSDAEGKNGRQRLPGLA